MSEIELILAKLRIVSEEKEQGMYLCDKEHSKLLLDYITNLQEENKELKERCDYLQRSCDRKEEQRDDARMEYMEQEDYKSRCEKAIEYIKQQDMKYYGAVVETKIGIILHVLNGGDKK